MKRFKRLVSLLTSLVMIMSTLAIAPMTAEAAGLDTLLYCMFENAVDAKVPYMVIPDSAKESGVDPDGAGSWSSNIAWNTDGKKFGFPSSAGNVMYATYNQPSVPASSLPGRSEVLFGTYFKDHGSWANYSKTIEDFTDTASLAITVKLLEPSFYDDLYVYIKSYPGSKHTFSAVKIDKYYLEEDIGTIKTISIPISRFMSDDEDVHKINGGFDPSALSGAGMMLVNPQSDVQGTICYDNLYICNVIKPTDLMITGSTADSVSLKWEESDSDITGYAIYRDGEKIGQTSADELTYTDEGLDPLSEYTYTVRAVDIYGAESNDSNAVLLYTAPLGRPENFKAQSSFDDAVKVQLTWDIPSYGTAVKYNIYRDDELLASVDGDNYEYIDSDVSENREYTYYVKSEDTDGNESMQSNVISLTASYIAAPTELEAQTFSSEKKVSLTWNTVDNAVGYIIECNGSELARVNENIGSYTHENIEYSRLYVYRVKAYNANGTVSLPTKDVYVTIDNPELNTEIPLFGDTFGTGISPSAISPNGRPEVSGKFETIKDDYAKGEKCFETSFVTGTSLLHGFAFVPDSALNMQSKHSGRGIISMYVKADSDSVIHDLKIALRCKATVSGTTYDVRTSLPLADYITEFGRWAYIEVPISEFEDVGTYRDGTMEQSIKFDFTKVTAIDIYLDTISAYPVNTVRFDEVLIAEYKSGDLVSAVTNKGQFINVWGTTNIDTSTQSFEFSFAYKLNPETVSGSTITLKEVLPDGTEDTSEGDIIPLLTEYDYSESKITLTAATPLKKNAAYAMNFDGVFTENGAQINLAPMKFVTNDSDPEINSYDASGFTIKADDIASTSGRTETVNLTLDDAASDAYVAGGAITLAYPKKLLSVSEGDITLAETLRQRGVNAKVSDGVITIDFSGLDSGKATKIGKTLAEIKFRTAGAGADNMKPEGSLTVLSGSDRKTIPVVGEETYISITSQTTSGGSTSGGSTSTPASREEGSGTRATTPPVKVTTPIKDGSELADASEVGWAEEAINYLSKNGYVNGYDDNTFRPNNNVTRAEFVSMLVRAFDIKGSEKGAEFADVKADDWYYAAVSAAASSGIVEGYDGKFGASDTISRQDMCTMVYRAAKLAGMEIPDNYGGATFADDADISGYAKESIDALQRAGIVNGVEDNKFMPGGVVTRAMAAKVLYGLLKVQPDAGKSDKEGNEETGRSAGKAKRSEESALRLKAFGIIDSNDVNSGQEENITGSEFLAWIMKAVGLSNIYSDEKAVDAAYKLGYISENDGFAPEAALCYNNAVKIVMEILGYGVMAEQQGGYPNGYLSAAGRTGVIKNISPEADGTITRTSAIRLLDNVLEADCMEASGDKTEIKYGKNLMNTCLDIDKYSGTIESADRYAGTVLFISDNKSLTFNVSDEISIYSVIADDADIYVKDDEILYISYKGTVTVMYDFIEEVNGDSSSVKEYMTSGISDVYLTNAGKKYKTDSKLNAFYEDKSIEWASAPIAGSFAQVTLKDGKLIEIQAYPLYEGGVIYHASFDMLKYRKGTDSNNVINNITDVNDLLIYLDGTPIGSVDELAPEMVFDYWISDDDDKLIIVASSRSFNAELESIGTDSVKASGVEYDVSTIYGCYAYNNTSKRYEKFEQGSSIAKSYMGKTATFVIDDRKQLRYIRATEAAITENYFLGVVMKAICDDSGELLPENVTFNVYNVSDGTGEKLYELADSMKKSPVSIEYAKSMAKNLDGKGFFKFTLNSDGKISRIEIPQYWGDEFTFTSDTSNETPSVIGKLSVRTARLFAVYSDEGEFKVKELDWSANLQNASFNGSVHVISDFDVYNNPIPNYVMFARGSENLHSKRGDGWLWDIKYLDDEKGEISIWTQWGIMKHKVKKETADKYIGRYPMLVDFTSNHIAGDEIVFDESKCHDISGTPETWQTDTYTEFGSGFFKVDKILFFNDEFVQFEINGTPTNPIKLSPYFYAMEYTGGKKTSFVRQTGNTPLSYISPGDDVWFSTVGLDDYGNGVGFVIYRKNGIAPRE